MSMVLAGLLAQVQNVEVERQWADLFFGLDGGQRFVLLLVVVGCLTGIIIATVVVIGESHRRRVEMDLKREMIERGMSAEDVSQVLGSSTAGKTPSSKTVDWHKK